MIEEELFSIDFVNLKETANALGVVGRGLRGRPMRDAMDEVVEAILRDLDELVPRWHGILAGSIDTEVTAPDEHTVEGVIFSDLDPYAPQQERGRAAYWPDQDCGLGIGDSIREWAEEHGTTAFVVARAIADRGIIAQDFFKQALEENAELIYMLFDNVVARLVESGSEEA